MEAGSVLSFSSSSSSSLLHHNHNHNYNHHVLSGLFSSSPKTTHFSFIKTSSASSNVTSFPKCPRLLLISCPPRSSRRRRSPPPPPPPLTIGIGVGIRKVVDNNSTIGDSLPKVDKSGRFCSPRHQIVINEAVDLAKRFCDGAAPRIINGCLRTYIKEYNQNNEAQNLKINHTV